MITSESTKLPPQCPLPSPKSPTSSPPLRQDKSTLNSLKTSSIYSWFPVLLNQLWQAIKSLFLGHQEPTEHNATTQPKQQPTTQPEQQPTTQPEQQPNATPDDDPFHKVTFTALNTLRNSEAYNKVCELFEILGTGGTLNWGWNLRKINRLKEEILNCHIHPLESLYLLFNDGKITRQVCHFLDNTGQSIASQFFQEHAAEFTAYKKQEDIEPCIPGFCRLLELNKDKVEEFAREKKWEDLIKYTQKIRRERFKV